jgi:malate dehydrogenase (oxaloacetate-decarboxylating)(NADP+)
MTRQSDTGTFREAALDYHEFPTPGKLAITPTKQMINQRDLSLAYSLGVAFACEEIVESPLNGARFTARGNLVGVVTNGTAVLDVQAAPPPAGSTARAPEWLRYVFRESDVGKTTI